MINDNPLIMSETISSESEAYSHDNVPVILNGKFFRIISSDEEKSTVKYVNCVNHSGISALLRATSNFKRHLTVKICNHLNYWIKNYLINNFTYNKLYMNKIANRIKPYLYTLEIGN